MAAIAGSRFGIARQSRSMARSLPWLVVCAWLMCAVFAFWFFQLRAPRSDAAWCGGSVVWVARAPK
jgi:hypothetical protein